MNLPNRLTILRFFLAPLFFIMYQLMFFTQYYVLYLSGLTLIWLLIEITDFTDGLIARKRKLVTDLGKVMDPFADVFARLTYFVCFTYSGLMPVTVFLIIMYREFAILFLRLLMMKQSTAVAANFYGKAKAVFYALSAILTIAYLWLVLLNVLDPYYQGLALTIVKVTYINSAILAVISFIIYAYRIKKSKALRFITR